MNQTAKIANEHQTMFIGRQPIFDSHSNVFAYELLYRNSSKNFAEITNGEKATANVIVNAFVEIGVDTLVGDCKAFINIPRGLLLSQEIYGLPTELVVLEILEDIVIDDELLRAVKSLRAAGYTIALDDFVYDETKSEIVKLADIVKLDMVALTQAELCDQIESMQAFNVKLLAEKIETRQEFDDCRQMGFDYYQGYYFCKPEVVSGAKIPTNKLAILQVFSKIYDDDVSMQEMESLISQDVSLSYKLLKAINSATFATSVRIDSIKQAITLLGLQRVRNWVSFIIFSESDNKPVELFKMSMLRAKMCEVMAGAFGVGSIETSFTVGMFSCLDAIMDQPLDKLLEPLPLSEEIKDAVLTRKGPLGEILDCVISYEQGGWEAVSQSKFSSDTLTEFYVESLHWTEDIYKTLA